MLTTERHPGDGDAPGVLVATMDDGKANALSMEMMAAITAAIGEAESDDAIGAMVLAGRPGVFCGGFDLNVMRGGDATAITEMVATGGDLVARLYGSRVPVVVASTGHAVAAGGFVLLGSDLRIGADGEFNYGLPEVNISMALPQWAITIATERLSKRHLLRSISHGRLTGPSTAVDVGFLDEVVPADLCVDSAVESAMGLAAAMHLPSYGRIVDSSRTPVIEAITAQAAADRAAAAQL